MEVLTQAQGLLLIGVFFIAMFSVLAFLPKSKRTKKMFLVGNRSISWVIMGLSMAATWVWAPSMFTAAEKGYTQGFVGLFWFVAPNVLTLLLFGYFATRMRERKPNGWTFSYYMKEKYSNRTHTLYVVESIVLQMCSMAVQLLAGGVIFSKICGLNFFLTTIILAAIPLIYAAIDGIKGTAISDFVKMAFIAAVLLLGLPIMFSNAGVDTFIKGLGGITGDCSSLFSKQGLAIFLSFGIPSTISLLSGTFGDQMFWQRAFSVRRFNVKKTMVLAACMFAIVPICLGSFGLFAAGGGLEVQDTQLTNVAAVTAFLPKWFLYLFFLMILSGLISTVDSVLCAFSSVGGHDIMRRLQEKGYCKDVNPLSFARWFMVVISLFGVAIANIPLLTITSLWLMYGMFRASVMMPTVFATVGSKMHERGIFYGILAAWIIGWPAYVYASLSGNTPLIVATSLFVVLVPAISAKCLKGGIKATKSEEDTQEELEETDIVINNLQ